MPMHGTATWPGVLRVQRCDYSVSHGTAPGVVRMQIAPQARVPDMVGNVVMSDGLGDTLVVPQCRLDRASVQRNAQGKVVALMLWDRRWRWKELGGISGVYNQLDPAGKVRPFMARTPYQLAELCLLAMGEVNYTIVLPNVPVLPPVSWNHVPPAQALEALVNSLGCRVCYRLDTDSVLVAPLGVGADLPGGFVSEESLELDLPERPDAIHCVGQALRIQGRLRCKPKAEEWNGEYVDLNDASYRPALADVTVHQVKVTPQALGLTSFVAGDTFTVRLDDVEYSATYQSGMDPVAVVVAGLKAQIDLTPQFPWRAFDDATHLTIYGGGDGTPFDCVVSGDTSLGASITWELVEQGTPAQTEPWSRVPPYTMATVRATERLDKRQAIQKALDTVFKVYEITVETPEVDREGPLKIPDYAGPIVRKEQIVLQTTRAEQIEPAFEERDANGNPIVQVDENGRIKRALFYDGHSRDKPARCFGSYFHCYGKRVNTDPAGEILVPFQIDTTRQVVKFAQPVYTMTPGRIAAAEVVLEVAFNLRDAATNALVCFEGFREFPRPHFGTPPLTIVREDVQATLISVYDDNHRLLGAVGDNFPEARRMLDYYMQAYAAQYELTAAQTRTYPGLKAVFLDGAIQQVTFKVGGGTATTASRNGEHSRYVPPYPRRLRDGAMDPAARGKRGANPPAPGAGPGPAGVIDMTQGQGSQLLGYGGRP